MLKEDKTHNVPHNEQEITLFISNTYDVFFNFTHMSEEWKIGNLKTNEPQVLIRRIVEEDIPALNIARRVTMQELVARYGNVQSDKAFQIEDYKMYLLNLYIKDNS